MFSWHLSPVSEKMGRGVSQTDVCKRLPPTAPEAYQGTRNSGSDSRIPGPDPGPRRGWGLVFGAGVTENCQDSGKGDSS